MTSLSELTSRTDQEDSQTVEILLPPDAVPHIPVTRQFYDIWNKMTDSTVYKTCISWHEMSSINIIADLNILSINWRHIHWPSFGKGVNKGSVLLWYSSFDRYAWRITMSYQYIETLSDEAVKLYQSVDFCFPSAKTRSIKWMWRQLTERIHTKTEIYLHNDTNRTTT